MHQIQSGRPKRGAARTTLVRRAASRDGSFEWTDLVDDLRIRAEAVALQDLSTSRRNVALRPRQWS